MAAGQRATSVQTSLPLLAAGPDEHGSTPPEAGASGGVLVSGHRRISMELWIKYRGRRWSDHLRFLLEYDYDVSLSNSPKTLSEYAAYYPMSRSTIGRLILEYKRNADELRVGRVRGEENQGVTRLSRDADETRMRRVRTPSSLDPDPHTHTQKKNKSRPPEWATQSAEVLREHLKKTPGAQIPQRTNGWAGEIARIQADPAEIRETIDWLFSPDNSGQYAFVVQSGRALREKYGRIRVAMRPVETALEREEARLRAKGKIP